MPNKYNYVRLMLPREEFSKPRLQEFDNNNNPVGPQFRPASDLILVSKQIEIIRRTSQRMTRLPDVLMAKTEEPDSLRPVIGIHMKVFDPHIDFDDCDKGTSLYNLETQNMRFQRFTSKEIFEDVYVQITQENTTQNKYN